MENVYMHIPHFNPALPKLVLATIISTQGSTPQKPGSSALFDKNGLIYGTIGGGVLEGKVQKIARKAALSGKSGVYQFDLDKDISFKAEAICGGRVTVLVDAAVYRHAALKSLQKSIKKRVPSILLTVISGGGKKGAEITRFHLGVDKGKNIDEVASESYPAPRLVKAGTAGDYSHLPVEISSLDETAIAFIEPVYPPPHMVIAGAGHIGRELCHLGKRLGFDITVLDDRKKFANSRNLPEADNIIAEDIGRAMKKIEKTPNTYIIIVSRGHSDDAEALKNCIGSKAAYIGMIGSKTKVAQMHLNFVKHGFATEKQWAEIHTPIGIKINSKTVEEIAISIAAEIIQVKNKKL